MKNRKGNGKQINYLTFWQYKTLNKMDSPCESINAIVHFCVFKVFMFNRTIFDSNILESTEDYLLKLFKTQLE